MPGFLEKTSGIIACVILSALVLCGGCIQVQRVPDSQSPAVISQPDVNAAQPPADAGQPTEDHGEDAFGSPYFLFTVAERYIQKEDYLGALPYLRQAIELDPESDFLKKEIISLYLLLKDRNKALETAQELVLRNPEDTDALMILAKLKQFMKQNQEAREIYQKILELNPDNESIYMILGRQYLEDDMIDEAFNLYSTMAYHFPESYVAHFFLGRIHRQKLNSEHAEKEFMESIRLNPDLVEPRFELIDLYRSMEGEAPDRGPDIIRLYGEILEIEPGSIKADLELTLYLYHHGELFEAGKRFARIGLENADKPDMVMLVAREYIGSERFKDAAIVFPGLLRGAPRNATLHYFAGVAFDALKDTPNALHHFSQVSPGSDHYKKSAIHMAFLYSDTGEKDKAIGLLEERNRELPQDVDIMLYLASFYEEAGRHGEAITLLTEGLDRVGDTGTVLFRLGVIQDKAGLKNDCIETMKRVIELEPDNATALNYLGYTYADLGQNLEEAEELITRALALKPNDGFITDSLGWVYYKLGQYDRAIPVLEKAAELSSWDPVIVEHLGDAYLKAGQADKALESYLKAREASAGDTHELNTKIRDLEKSIHEK